MASSPEPDFPFGTSPKPSSYASSLADKHLHPLRGRLTQPLQAHAIPQCDLLEYPFSTMKSFPPGFITRIGGLVSCRAVKLLEGLDAESASDVGTGHASAHYGTRDGWWAETRQEVRSHARCLGCNFVVGYSEDAVIWEDVIVLCASGTAVVADMGQILDLDGGGGSALFGPPFVHSGSAHSPTRGGGKRGDNGSNEASADCSLLHVNPSEHGLPYACKTSRCGVCKKGAVPDVVFSTIEPSKGLDFNGRGCFIQAKVRQKSEV